MGSSGINAGYMGIANVYVDHLTNFMYRGGTLHRHTVGFNAGASLLYVAPWVVVVTEEDRMNLELFVVRIEQKYGLSLPVRCMCRQLVIDPQIVAGLPYVGDLEMGEVGMGKGKRKRVGRVRRCRL